MTSQVIARFEDGKPAHAAVQDLLAAGFEPSNIQIAPRGDRSYLPAIDGNLGLRGAATGAVAGALAGTVFGVMLGIGGIFLLTPGEFIIGARNVGIAGMISGVFTGGLFGALKGMSIPREMDGTAMRTQEAGEVVVTVEAVGTDIYRAIRILDRNGDVTVDDMGGFMPQPAPWLSRATIPTIGSPSSGMAYADYPEPRSFE